MLLILKDCLAEKHCSSKTLSCVNWPPVSFVALFTSPCFCSDLGAHWGNCQALWGTQESDIWVLDEVRLSDIQIIRLSDIQVGGRFWKAQTHKCTMNRLHEIWSLGPVQICVSIALHVCSRLFQRGYTTCRNREIIPDHFLSKSRGIKLHYGAAPCGLVFAKMHRSIQHICLRTVHLPVGHNFELVPDPQ